MSYSVNGSWFDETIEWSKCTYWSLIDEKITVQVEVGLMQGLLDTLNELSRTLELECHLGL